MVVMRCLVAVQNRIGCLSYSRITWQNFPAIEVSDILWNVTIGTPSVSKCLQFSIVYMEISSRSKQTKRCSGCQDSGWQTVNVTVEVGGFYSHTCSEWHLWWDIWTENVWSSRRNNSHGCFRFARRTSRWRRWETVRLESGRTRNIVGDIWLWLFLSCSQWSGHVVYHLKILDELLQGP